MTWLESMTRITIFGDSTRVTNNDSRLESETFLQNLQTSDWQTQFACTIDGRSHIYKPRLRSYSKIFQSGSGSTIFSNFSIRLPFKRRHPSMQPTFSNVLTFEIAFVKTTQTPATAENKEQLRARVFTNFWLWLRNRVWKKCRILPESTPALRIRDNLWFAHKEMSSFCFSDDQCWRKLSVMTVSPKWCYDTF